MSESSLVTKKWWANNANYEVGRSGYKIKGIVIHHAASTSLNSIGTVFSQASRGASAHYGVGGKEIHQYVSEANTAWHCGNWYGNHATVGIETTNSTGAPDWKVSDQTLDTIRKCGIDLNAWLEGFRDTPDSVRKTVETIKTHPLMPRDIIVRGFIIDSETGELEEVLSSR